LHLYVGDQKLRDLAKPETVIFQTDDDKIELKKTVMTPFYWRQQIYVNKLCYNIFHFAPSLPIKISGYASGGVVNISRNLKVKQNSSDQNKNSDFEFIVLNLNRVMVLFR